VLTARAQAGLVELRVDEEAVPEALEEVEDEAGQAVEEAEAEDVAVEPVEDGAQEGRGAAVQVELGPAAPSGLVG
jgi:hypothetical protein